MNNKLDGLMRGALWDARPDALTEARVKFRLDMAAQGPRVREIVRGAFRAADVSKIIMEAAKARAS